MSQRCVVRIVSAAGDEEAPEEGEEKGDDETADEDKHGDDVQDADKAPAVEEEKEKVGVILDKKLKHVSC